MSSSPPNQVPVLDLSPETDALLPELLSAVEAVMRAGRFILGPNVEAFEREVAEYLGVRHAVGLNSGTDALVIALRALGIGEGDEVVTTPFTFFATAEAISAVGATPVFVDIDPETFNLDPNLVKEKVTDRTRALLPVHLFGNAADLAALASIAENHGLRIVEDVAQAFGGEYGGRKLGTFGTASAFSFFPSKNLGAFGDGGLLTTDDDGVATRAQMLRAHGGLTKYRNEMLGYNSRLDELQAAILRVKLPHVDTANDGRRRVARRYSELLGDVDGVSLPCEAPNTRHVYHQYTIRVPGDVRDAVVARLAEAGIGTMVYYPVPLHRLPVYVNLAGESFPIAEAMAREVVSLPIWPAMPEETQDRVVAALRTALA